TEAARLEALDPEFAPAVADALEFENIRTAVVAPSPKWSDDGSARPGVPDGVERVAYLEALAAAGGNVSEFVPGSPVADATGPLNLELFFFGDSVSSGSIDLTSAPNSPLQPGQRIDTFYVDDEPFAELAISEEECDAGEGDGWIWQVPGELVLFCGAGRLAWSCTERPPWSDGLVVHADILCDEDIPRASPKASGPWSEPEPRTRDSRNSPVLYGDFHRQFPLIHFKRRLERGLRRVP